MPVDSKVEANGPERNVIAPEVMEQGISTFSDGRNYVAITAELQVFKALANGIVLAIKEDLISDVPVFDSDL